MKKLISLLLSLTFMITVLSPVNAESTELILTNNTSNGAKILNDVSQPEITENENIIMDFSEPEEDFNLQMQGLSLNNSAYDEADNGQIAANSIVTQASGTTYSSFNTVTSPSATNGITEPKPNGVAYGSEEISPYSGELTLRFNDITLAGRNGLDLNIGRTYQTTQAEIGKKILVQMPNEYGTLQTRLIWDYSNYYNDRYYLASGWAFDFPSVQVAKEYIPEQIGDTYYYEEEMELYYHTGDGSVYQVEFTGDETDSNLKGYDKKDIVFSQNDSSFSNGQITSAYSLTLSDKTKQYFGSDGRFLGIKDRFNNKIVAEHTMMPVTNRIPNGNFEGEEGLWYLSNANDFFLVDSDAVTGQDNSAMLFDVVSSGGATMISSPTQVEPLTAYQLSEKIYSQSGNNIKVEVLFFDAAHGYRGSETVYNGQVTGGTWRTVSNNFTTMSSTRYVRIQISVPNRARNLYVDDVSLDKLQPVISKITDSIGRTVDFAYSGDVNRSNDTGSVILTIRTPDSSAAKTIEYNRMAVGFSTEEFKKNTLRNAWYLTNSNAQGVDIGRMSYTYLGDQLTPGVHENLHSNAFSKTYSTEDIFINKPVISKIRYKYREYHYKYEKVTKHLGEDGYYDTLRVKSRYEQRALVDSGGYIYYDGEDNKYTYAYSGNYNGNAYNNETGYPHYYFTDETTLNEIFKATISSYNGNLLQSSFFSNGKLIKQEIDDKENTTTRTSEYTYDDVFKDSIKTTENTLKKGSGEIKTYQETSYNSWGGVQSQTQEVDAAIWSNQARKEKYTTTYQYHADYRLPTYTSYYRQEEGSLITDGITYDSMGRVIKTTNAIGDVTDYFYEDAAHAGNVTKITQPDPSRTFGLTGGMIETKFTYDAYGLFVKTVNESGSVTELEYDYIYGNPTYQSNPDDGETIYRYDTAGRLQYKYYPYTQGNGYLFYHFDNYNYSVGGVANHKDNLTYVFEYVVAINGYANQGEQSGYIIKRTEQFYDGLNRLCESWRTDYTRPAGGSSYRTVNTKQYYDSYGRPEKTIDDNGAETSYTYDNLNRLKAIASDNGGEYRYAYDDISRERVSYFKNTDHTEENHIKEQYDVFGNTTTRFAYPNGYGASPLSEQYAYDIAGNVTKITDPKGHETHMQYDNLNRLTKVTFADDASQTISYNKFGEVNFQKQFNEEDQAVEGRTSLVDERGNVYFKGYSNGRQLLKANSYQSDSMNRLVYASEGENVYTYDYDETGNLITQNSGPSTIHHRYNPRGLIISQPEDTNTAAVQFTYDAMNRQRQRYQDGNLLLEYTFKPMGMVDSMTDLFDLTVDYGYNNLHRLEQINAENDEYTYEYYDDGMLKTILYPPTANGVLKSTYIYDNLNRVTDITTTLNTTVVNDLSYTYDGNSNIETETRNGTVTAYTYDDRNRLETVDYGSETVEYKYDDRGNRFKETDGNHNVKIYTYNKFNQLESVSLNGTVTDTYKYNNIGSVAQHNNRIYEYNEWDKLTKFTDENGNVYRYKYDVEGNRVQKNHTKYIVDGNKNVIAEANASGNVTAQNVYGGNRILGRKMDGSWYYYLYNAHGDVIGMVDENGTVVNSYTYDAWGNVQTENETIDNPVKYAGEYYDEESGNIYLRARYYSPAIGRFMQSDPIENGDNWYIYCENNPVNFVDPWGLRRKGQLIQMWSDAFSDIFVLQLRLNILGYVDMDGNRLDTDGVFGSKTDYAVRKFQADNSLVVDGIVGDLTWEALGLPTNFDTSFFETVKNNNSLPPTGPPNSTQPLYDDDGKLKQERTYGSDGRAVKDTDYKHGGAGHEFPHEHEWDWSKNPPRQPSKIDGEDAAKAAGITALIGIAAAIGRLLQYVPAF